jgi:hypothetical protein
MNTGFDQYQTRRRSFSGGFPAGGGGGFPPPHSDGGYRRDGFSSDPYNSSYQEPFQPGGPGSFPSSGGMPASYSMGGTREPYSSSPYDSGMNSTGLPPPGPSAAYSNSYDSSPLSDNQYTLDDGGFQPRGRTHSTGGGFGPQAIVPSAPPMTPYPSHSHYSAKRSRRASSVGPGGMGFAGIVGDPYRGHTGRHPSGHTSIKFRLKGSTHSGISVSEALDRVRLSQGNAYLMHDVSVDMSGKISLKIRWSGYRSNIYSIPLSSDYHGYVDMQSLARRTSRAIVHFMQANGISLSWDRVVMHRLEEISPGLWIPVLITH